MDLLAQAAFMDESEDEDSGDPPAKSANTAPHPHLQPAQGPVPQIANRARPLPGPGPSFAHAAPTFTVTGGPYANSINIPPFSKVPPPYTAQPTVAPPPPPSPPSDDGDDGPLTAHEQAQLKDEGRFTKFEQHFLSQAIKEYCDAHNIENETANDYVCGKARAGNIPADFWDEVCKALPLRTKNSIQRAAKRVFRNGQKKGQWTAEEETALAEAYGRNPDQWAKVCEEVPGRSAEQCRDRWRNYTQNNKTLTRGPWTDTEEAQFVQICKEMLSRARADQEAHRRAKRLVPEQFIMLDHLNFTTISTMMHGSRSRLHCRNKWHKLKKRPDIMEDITKASFSKINDPAFAAATGQLPPTDQPPADPATPAAAGPAPVPAQGQPGAFANGQSSGYPQVLPHLPSGINMATPLAVGPTLRATPGPKPGASASSNTASMPRPVQVQAAPIAPMSAPHHSNGPLLAPSPTTLPERMNYQPQGPTTIPMKQAPIRLPPLASLANHNPASAPWPAPVMTPSVPSVPSAPSPASTSAASPNDTVMTDSPATDSARPNRKKRRSTKHGDDVLEA